MNNEHLKALETLASDSGAAAEYRNAAVAALDELTAPAAAAPAAAAPEGEVKP